MPAITSLDLSNAKLDVDHIAAIATSTQNTVYDRMGNTKLTAKGAVDSIKSFNPKGTRINGTTYLFKDCYSEDGVTYVVAVPSFVSVSVSADLASGNVVIYQGATKDFVLDTFSEIKNLQINPSTERVINPSKQKYMQSFGVETLQHWFKLFALDSNSSTSGSATIKKMVLSGDSVTYGTATTTGNPTNVFKITAAQRGYKNVTVINRGQPGKATFQWLTDYLSGDLAENPDLLVLGWGANDFGLGRTTDQFLQDLRSGLSTIRASKSVNQLSILIRTPTSMTDPDNNRVEYNMEVIIEGVKQIARDFQCAFVDSYTLAQNSHDAAGIWMDNIAGAGGVHPLNEMQEHNCGAISELILPTYGGDWKANCLYNYSSGQETRTLAAQPSNYFDGLSYIRTVGGSSQGAPYDGFFWTLKQADTSVLQFTTPLYGATGGYGISARLGFNNAWGPLLGARFSGNSILQNGWLQDAASQLFSYWLTLEGSVCIQGTVQGGTSADGTIIFTLPSGYRPTNNIVSIVATSSGFARATLNSAGECRIYGASGVAYICFSGLIFKN